jgi:hypothetical protein
MFRGTEPGPDGGEHPELARYLDLRDQALRVPKPEGEQLSYIQHIVGQWVEAQRFPDQSGDPVAAYTHFSEERVQAKIGGVIDFLETDFADLISPVEFEASRAFIRSAFSVFNGRQGVEPNGSSAFMVPARMSRNRPDYGEEVEPVIPVFRYLPKHIRAYMMLGLPPFIIDTYNNDPDNEGQDFIVFAPIFFEDMVSRLGSFPKAVRVGRANADFTANMVHSYFGVQLVGQGAIIPALTRYGKEFTNRHIITTTGHAATADVALRMVGRDFPDNPPKVAAVLGQGSIGASISEVLAYSLPDSKVLIYDTQVHLAERVAENLRKLREEGKPIAAVEIAANEAQLLRDSDVVISAITTVLDLKAMGLLPGELRHLDYCDDSQPSSIIHRQAMEMGLRYKQIIAHDTRGIATRRAYNYASLVDLSDLFPCEAELAVLRAKRRDLLRSGVSRASALKIISTYAISEKVTAKHIPDMHKLLDDYGIVPAQPQANGQLV